MTLFGYERVGHIAEMRKQARISLHPLTHKFSSQLSYYETYDLMVRAIEDIARCDAATIRRRAEAVTEGCRETDLVRKPQ